MRFKLPGRLAPFVVTFLVVLTAAVPLSGPRAQEGTGRSFWGRTKIVEPERTDAGNFEGTWWYLSKDHRVALWVKYEDGEPRLKYRFLSTNTGEGFVTDWEGQASYVHRGRTGSYSIAIDEADENVISGNWRWELAASDWSRLETSGFKLYRSGNGRRLIMKFQDFNRTYEGGPPATFDIKQQFWSFHKASRHEALWAELPF